MINVRDNALKHGMAKSPEHNAWCLMKARCYNKNHPRYAEWGGRGIRMDLRWKKDFMEFFLDMGLRPSPQHSLDRIDNNKGYCPGNVRWATKEEQSSNRPGFCVYFTLNGKTQTLIAWSRELGINRSTIDDRRKRGLPVEAILSRVRSNARAK